MRTVLGSAVACSLLLLAGCGDQWEPAGIDQPTPTPTRTLAATPAPSPRTPDRVVTTIPDDFPLLDGYPPEADAEPEEHNGREGPSRSMKPVVPEACDATVEVPEHTDWLRASWTNPEDYRQRQLLAFADAGQAQAYADDVLDLYRACPREVAPGELHESQLATVDVGELGDFSGAVTSTYAYDDSPEPGMVVTHVVRVGTGVLVSLTYNEAGAGLQPDREAAQQRADAARQISGVVEAMQVFAGTETVPSEPASGPGSTSAVTDASPR